MSVWCTRLVLAGEFPDEEPAPLIYKGSHIIPAADGERGGWVDTAHLPAFITRDGSDDGPEDGLSWWPYLRLSVRPGVWNADTDEDTVVLDVAQVDALIADLTAWRAGVDEGRT